MPDELLPTIIVNLHRRIVEGFPTYNDQTGLLVSVLISHIFLLVIVNGIWPNNDIWDGIQEGLRSLQHVSNRSPNYKKR